MRRQTKVAVVALVLVASAGMWWVSAQSAGPAQQAAQRTAPPGDYPAQAVGHAVRATYMYSGIADVAALTGDAAYMKTSDTIWNNLVAKKLYITGGIGATGRGEGVHRHGRARERPGDPGDRRPQAANGRPHAGEAPTPRRGPLSLLRRACAACTASR